MQATSCREICTNSTAELVGQLDDGRRTHTHLPPNPLIHACARAQAVIMQYSGGNSLMSYVTLAITFGESSLLFSTVPPKLRATCLSDADSLCQENAWRG